MAFMTKYDLLTTYAYIRIVMEKHGIPCESEALKMEKALGPQTNPEALNIDIEKALGPQTTADEKRRFALLRGALKMNGSKASSRGKDHAEFNQGGAISIKPGANILTEEHNKNSASLATKQTAKLLKQQQQQLTKPELIQRLQQEQGTRAKTWGGGSFLKSLLDSKDPPTGPPLIDDAQYWTQDEVAGHTSNAIAERIFNAAGIEEAAAAAKKKGAADAKEKEAADAATLAQAQAEQAAAAKAQRALTKRTQNQAKKARKNAAKARKKEVEANDAKDEQQALEKDQLSLKEWLAKKKYEKRSFQDEAKETEAMRKLAKIFAECGGMDPEENSRLKQEKKNLQKSLDDIGAVWYDSGMMESARFEKEFLDPLKVEVVQIAPIYSAGVAPAKFVLCRNPVQRVRELVYCRWDVSKLKKEPEDAEFPEWNWVYKNDD